jgi:hypothetical protein
VFSQSHFGFAKGPVFVTRQPENGQQLRLVELVLARAASVARKHRLEKLQGDASKGQESYFGHRTSCLDSRHHFLIIWHLDFHCRTEGVNRGR